MKTTKILFIVLAFVTLNGVSFAEEKNEAPINLKFDARVQLTNQETAILRCVNTKFDNLIVQFYDNDGVLLHERKICESCNFKFTYSLSRAPHGKYLVKILNDRKAIYTQKIEKKYGKYFLQ